MQVSLFLLVIHFFIDFVWWSIIFHWYLHVMQPQTENNSFITYEQMLPTHSAGVGHI